MTPVIRLGFIEEGAGSRLGIFSAEEKGSHFMFRENPDKFNAVVRSFVG